MMESLNLLQLHLSALVLRDSKSAVIGTDDELHLSITDLPVTLFSEILRGLDLRYNCYFRRVSKYWSSTLTQIMNNNQLCVDVSYLQSFREVKASKSLEIFNSFRKVLGEWFTYKNVNRYSQRSVLTFGHNEPRVYAPMIQELQRAMCDGFAHFALYSNVPRWCMWANLHFCVWELLQIRKESLVPEQTKILLSGIRIDGINWWQVLPLRSYTKRSLFRVKIDRGSIEEFNIGPMNKGYLFNGGTIHSYMYGDGEEEMFGKELMRLGRRYAKPMDMAAIFTLFWSLHYCCQYSKRFKSHVNMWLPRHEPGLFQNAGNAIEEIIYQRTVKLQDLHPLTLRLLDTFQKNFEEPHSA